MQGKKMIKTGMFFFSFEKSQQELGYQTSTKIPFTKNEKQETRVATNRKKFNKINLEIMSVSNKKNGA